MDPFATLGNNIQPLMAKYLKHSEKNVKILKKNCKVSVNRQVSDLLPTPACENKQYFSHVLKSSDSSFVLKTGPVIIHS